MHIKIDLKICLILIIFFFCNQLELYLLFMIFTIIHEMGHLITGLILGFKPKGINIMPMGLSICFYINTENYNLKFKNTKIINLKKLFIAISGPLINLVMAVICMFYNIKLFGFETEQIIYTNLLIAVFNLIPIYPLDGGRIAKCILDIYNDLRKAYRYTNKISNITLIILTIVSSIAILYLKNIAILFIIVYLWILTIRENIYYNKKMQLYRLMSNLEIENNLYEYDMKL